MTAKIQCPIDLFPRQETEIVRLVQSINDSHAVSQKLPWAQDLIKAVDILLTCEQYNPEVVDCRLCRHFSQLRREVAGLVIQAGRI